MAGAAGRPDAAQIHAVHAGFVRHGRGGCGAPCPPSWLLPDGAWATEMVMSACFCWSVVWRTFWGEVKLPRTSRDDTRAGGLPRRRPRHRRRRRRRSIEGASTAMKFLVTVDRDEDGAWVAECPAIPGCGCVSQDSTREEAAESIREAIVLCLDARRKGPASHQRDPADRSGHVDATASGFELPRGRAGLRGQRHSAVADPRRQPDRRGVPRSRSRQTFRGQYYSEDIG